MRIGCLQFGPSLGQLTQNIQRAEAILAKACPKDLDLLILPELAFTGYNFKSLADISPHLEPTIAGPSTTWAISTARRLNCYVTVGYPEIARTPQNTISRYNSAVMVSPAGTVIANYRKHHLYETDETWAEEGSERFFSGDVPKLGRVAMGICMDLNPYRYLAPFRAYEFATHVLATSATLILLPMAWLTNESRPSLETHPAHPDMNTLYYWRVRLQPLVDDKERDQELVVVACNRTGTEGEAAYAGTSSVIGVRKGEMRHLGVLGRGVEELLVVDTEA